MKTYTIGELLNAFGNVDYIAYCFKGDMAGTFILGYYEEEVEKNVLFWLDTEGKSGYDFYFQLVGLDSLDNHRNYVFLHEIKELDTPESREMLAKFFKDYLNSCEAARKIEEQKEEHESV
jgi:hypothetical protein